VTVLPTARNIMAESSAIRSLCSDFIQRLKNK
ncbi:MAG: hypothetical protein ACJAUV_001837, partial [Flavobacteriales bacterium]